MSRDLPAIHRVINRQGWKLNVAARDEEGDSLVALAINTIDGRAGIRRRLSRHAETWLTKLGEDEFFVKIISPARGFAKVKRFTREYGAMHVAKVTAELTRDGFQAPTPIVWGREASTGRELIVTKRAPGKMLPRFLRENAADLRRKRETLHELGAEIARLHRLGYLHGDLTPFNILVGDDGARKFILIDHERTRKTWLTRFQRPRLRNLVQLGHFTLPHVTRTDRMRVWQGYIGERNARRELNRLMRMVGQRLGRDARRPLPDANRVVAHGQVRET